MIRTPFLRTVALAGACLCAFSFVSFASAVGNCDGGVNGSVAECFDGDGYKPEGALTVGDGTIEEGVKSKMVAITNRVITAVALVSVGAIVFAGFHMVTAYGDDERHKKGKDALKWGVVGFATALLSFAIVNAVINFFYGIR